MLTTVEPNWEFEDCTGYLVGPFSGGTGSDAKVYAPNLMAKITRSTKVVKSTISLKSANQIFINTSTTRPKTATKVTSVNYINATVTESVVKKKSNEDLYEKYQSEMPYPTPIYYIPFEIELPAGEEIYLTDYNGDMTGLHVTVKNGG
jgi:hypothetical protein